MKILQISSELNVGSVGKIAEQIGEEIIKQGWKSYIAYGRDGLPSSSQTFKIGDKFDKIKHGIYTRITDRHAFASVEATKSLVKKIELIDPDIIHLQHLHGYYINIEILFNCLSKKNIPVVWTFHDCWSFTGHCAHYEFIGCEKWLTQCKKCPQKSEYPKSSLIDNSFRNFIDKKRIFNSVKNITIIPVSNWLGEETRKSFLKDHSIKVIHNGIDLSKFKISDKETIINTKRSLKIGDEFVILGVANPWSVKKGLNYFVELSERLSCDYKIVMVGLSQTQLRNLPKNIIGLERTKNVQQLAELYAAANAFLNPTLEDTFPTTNLESLACGTPVITFQSGGSPEAINEQTGFVLAKGDIVGLCSALDEIKKNGREFYSEKCRKRAELLFDKEKNFENYINLYKELLEK
jgi:putative colanic acid biosynthesis glycosyltransferase